ncbi:MAG: SRPBCC family protein [Candidatus Rokuibacteriota bacterium]
MKIALIVLGVAIAGFLVFVATRPDTYHVERSRKIAAPADVVFAHLDDFKAWPAWSPWEKDPNVKKTFAGPAKGVGATYSWEGNKQVGKGKITVTRSTPPTAISYRLEFIEPFASIAAASFTLEPEGERAATVTWSMDGHNNFAGKAISVFMNMDRMIGGEFEKGLASLESISEAEARK